MNLPIAAPLLLVTIAGCHASVAPTSALNTQACPGTAPDPLPIMVLPAQPRIDHPFTVRMIAVARPGQTEAWPPDGTYRLELEKVTVVDLPGCAPLFSTLSPVERAVLGPLTVSNGVGEAQFTLQQDYGNVKPESGGGLMIFAFGESGGQGFGFVVGRN